MAEPEKRSLQQRLESSDVGRSLISAVLLITLGAVLVSNLSTSELKRDLSKRTQPYLNALALDQAWGMFAPEPRRTSVFMHARITYADGSKGTWRPPRNGPVVGHFHDNRWRKWMELAASNLYVGTWRPAAVYVAQREARRGRRPVQVELVRRWQHLKPPGQKPAAYPWKQQTYIRLKVTDAVLREKT